jgi:lysozyme
MKVSDEFIQFLASWEGERLQAYQVQGERFWTIGVGHTGKVDGVQIHRGMKITRAKSRQLLRQDLDRFEQAVKRYVPWRWRRRRRRFETCVSLSFNMGEAILTPEPPLETFAARMRKRVNKRSINSVADAIKLYNKGGQPLQVMEGLVRRRSAEVSLFKNGVYRHNR